MVLSLQSILIAVLSIVIGAHYSGIWTFPTHRDQTLSATDIAKLECHPFLPPLFAETPPAPNNPLIVEANQKLDDFLLSRFSKGDIDSLSVTVVSSDGPLYEKNFGVLRTNETESRKTDSHSMYRIASVTKLFTMIEALILEQKGVLSLYVI